MNTTDVEVKGLVKNFEDLYRYAKEQFLMYEKLEGIDDWEKYDFCIDCPEDQAKFKDMLQIRFIEELTEASVTLGHKDHFIEEITDSLNFFLSAYLMAGIDLLKLPSPGKYLATTDGDPDEDGFPTRYVQFDDDGGDLPFSISRREVSELFYGLVEKVGFLCNLLKNRPWAQSNYLVSILDFNKRVEDLWVEFWDCLGYLGFTELKVFEIFERKYKVNLFRVETGY